ncbi:MAG: YqgE/AlgH family protein [Novosphingobium sp.]
MTESEYLVGKFLLAMPGMGDPRFDHAVIAMMAHDGDGALGVGLGKVRGDLRLHDLFENVGLDPARVADGPVLDGGPVEPQRGFVLHTPDWQGPGTIQAGALCAMSSSLNVLKAIAEGTGPAHYVVALGYAGWSGGQLESEMQRHGWQTAGGSAVVLYDTPPEARWTACWRESGIDPTHLAGVTGRA